MTSDSHLLELIVLCCLVSVLSIGGGPKLVAPLSYEVVTLHHWMSGALLGGLFGLSRALPGPAGLVFLTGTVGWMVAGTAGALAAPCAVLLPSSLITYLFSKFWEASSAAAWRATVTRILVPLSIGQGVVGGIAVLQLISANMSGLSIAILAFGARLAGLPSLLILGGGGLLGAAMSYA